MSEVYNRVMLDLKKMNAIAGRDGYLIGEHVSEGSETLVLMSANMLQATETVTNKLEKVNSNRVIVDYQGGKLITASVGSKALITIMTEKDAKIEPIIDEIEKTAGKIKENL